MTIPTLVALFCLALATGLMTYWMRNYFALRGPRTVTCPATGAPAGIEVNAFDTAVALGEPAAMKVARCSEWPGRAGCAQECLAQIHKAPDGCLVRARIATWYEGKTCARCRKDLSPALWPYHKPALRAPDGTPLEWSEVKPEDVPRVMETHAPICWDCYLLTLFVRQHPGRAFVRQRPARGTDD